MLTMRGKALEAGAEGDIINVLNVQSKRTVQATVTGPGRVTVAAAAPRIAAAVAPHPQRPSAAATRVSVMSIHIASCLVDRRASSPSRRCSAAAPRSTG